MSLHVPKNDGIEGPPTETEKEPSSPFFFRTEKFTIEPLLGTHHVAAWRMAQGWVHIHRSLILTGNYR